MHVNELKTAFGVVNIPMGYKYKRKVYFVRNLLDMLHKLRVISNVQHYSATKAAMRNTKLFDRIIER